MPLVLIPGLLAAGIGSLVSIGMGSWTGLSGANISLGTLPLPAFTRPDLVDFVWTIPLAVAVAVATVAFFRGGREIQRLAEWRMFLVLPAIGLAVSGLAIAFSEATGKSVSDVQYSGQDQVAGLVSHAGSWSLSALALLIAFKGVAYALSLGSFRGGPTFPAIFLGAAGGLMAAQLPGFSTTPAVAVCIGAAVVAALRLPLTAVVLATLFTFKAGLGAGPLIILAVAVAYVTTNLISAPPSAAETAGPGNSSTAQAPAAAAAGP